MLDFSFQKNIVFKNFNSAVSAWLYFGKKRTSTEKNWFQLSACYDKFFFSLAGWMNFFLKRRKYLYDVSQKTMYEKLVMTKFLNWKRILVLITFFPF